MTNELPNDLISSLDTAITPETNIENLHAKIKYLNNQLNLKKYELKQLTEKLDDVKEKWKEVVYEWRLSSDLPRVCITSMNSTLGIKED